MTSQTRDRDTTGPGPPDAGARRGGASNGGRTIARLGRVVRRAIRGWASPARVARKPGAAPGIELANLTRLPTTGQVYVTCTDYGPDQVQVHDIASPEALAEDHRPEWATVRWINIDGLSDMSFIQAIARKYQLHPLAIEDVLHTPQRPKVDNYPGNETQHARLFVVVRMFQLVDGHLQSEQISMFLGNRTVLTFQETHGDVWDPIRQRLATAGTRLRNNDASFLLYALIDAIVDHCFPILDKYCDRIERLEDALRGGPKPVVMQEIQEIKRELLLLRRQIAPLRDVVQSMQREPHECISETTRLYLRDVYDHVVHTIDLLETYREFAQGLADSYNSAVAIRANEVMRLLTLIATIFIPITFVTGLFGMNFQLPWQDHPWSFGVVVLGCAGAVGGMLLYFRRRGWL
ncbi:MAG: magnesium/cobalt transporter CorA [Phycisphaeraceae bacterium]|nr:MAG: magnesium/cobalt transporter CorA [Phycisphaeraceae bacterium]